MRRSLLDHLTPYGVLLTLTVAACGPERTPPPSELVLSHQVPTWFEDGWSFYDVSLDGTEGVFGARFGRAVFDLALGVAVPERYGGALESASDAFYDAQGRLWTRRPVDGEVGWWVQGPNGPERASLPADAAPRLSPDGTHVAYYRGTAGSGPSLFVGKFEAPVELDLGGLVTGIGWAPDGGTAYALSFRSDGTSALYRIDAEGEAATLVRDELDAPARFNSIAVTRDGAHAYLSLVGVGPPDAEARHDPQADRDLDIYRIDLVSGALKAVVGGAGDDFRPLIRGEDLYWTHNEYGDHVVVLPVDGGEGHQVVSDGQIPYWSADGRSIAFTFGGWVLADWALNMDAWVVDVDEGARAVSDPRPLIVGYHEDFTPAWSPDGRWLAYHSHRSAEPVANYFSEGGTDDIYLREAEAPMDAEIRLMDFGWEVGMADWDRTGTRLYFDSWERGGPPGVSHPWIATIDPETGRSISIDPLPLPEGFGGTVLAAWSPVADQLAVVEHVAGERHAIWLMAPDGSGAQRVVEYRASTYGGVDWTHDGDRLIYGALTSEGGMQIFIFDLQRGSSVRLTDGPDDHVQPQVSPDGRWVAATRLHHLKELRRRALR